MRPLSGHLLRVSQDAQHVAGRPARASSSSRQPRRRSSANSAGTRDTSSRPSGSASTPSKSPPMPTCSTPATSRTWSTWSATWASVARGHGLLGAPARRRSPATAAAVVGVLRAPRRARARPARATRRRPAGETNPGTNVTMHTPPLRGQRREHVVGHVARVVAQRTRAGVAEDHRRARWRERGPHRRGRDVREVDEHAEPVHLAHDLDAERRSARRAAPRPSRSRPRRCCRCGSGSCSGRRGRTSSAARRATPRCCGRPRSPPATRSGPRADGRARRPRRYAPGPGRPGTGRAAGGTPSSCSSVAVTPRARAGRTARTPTRTARRRRRPAAAAGRCAASGQRPETSIRSRS